MRPFRIVVLACALAACGLAGRATAADTKGKLLVTGSFGVGAVDYSETRTFTQFVEQGRIDAAYTNSGKVGVELGLQYNLVPHFGLQAGYALNNRDTDATITASIPHPFYFNQPRTATAQATDYSYRESIIFVDLVGNGRSGKWEYDVFAGVSFFKVEPDVVSEIQFNQTYPYDSVTITGTPKTSLSANKTGYNVGANLDYHFSEHVGFGIQGRYSRAKFSFVTTPGNNLDLDAGGFQAGAGI